MLLLALHAVIPPVAAVPADWRQTAALVEAGVVGRLFPGAVVVVGRRDSVLFARGFGHLTWSRGAGAPDPATTLWDLASLTKVVATASSVMTLVNAGRLDLDELVERYLPRFHGAQKDRVTVRMLLNHTSGMPAFAPLYRAGSDRRSVIDALFAVALRAPPGSRVEYSDLNAILLGLLVEAITETPFDRFVGGAVLAPLGMSQSGFAVADLTRVAPSLVRNGQPAPGVVNDPNARAMGGVAGHAGLFATGLDLARFAQTWLRNGYPTAAVRWVEPAIMQRFLERSPGAERRALGWESPDFHRLEDSPFGRLSTETTFGHTGWTGTFLWFDPTRDLFLVLLTNRSLGPATRKSLRAMRELRAMLSDEVTRATAAEQRRGL